MEPRMELSGREQEPGAVRLLDLPWEDVLLPHVLSRVPLRQLLRLQRVSRAFRALVQLHLAGLRRFDAAQVSRGPEPRPAWVAPPLAPSPVVHPSDPPEPQGLPGKRARKWGIPLKGRSQVGPQIPRAALTRLLRDAEGLQELMLAPCHEWLSDEDLVPVLVRNPQLRSVALAGCGQLSRRALGALAEGCPRLQRLSLAHCDWVDGLALRGLADRCPALEELDLTACRQLKDEAIVYLAQRRGAGLRSLSLAVNANVGDTAVQELARNCPQLEHLDLTGCLRVGSDGIRTLTEYCRALRSLRVRHCHHVAEPSLSRLRKRGVDIDVEPPLHQALVLLQDVVGFAPFVNLQV
ncbi:F-box/LRR-repeat protein 15 isoform X1 [Loxodonta africana]|uniref:F-box/LRR-repeat protein 15 isoform X1 n=1 Tax=Loxodonta africana TaxID=9785 RepID=UPI0030D094AA